MREGEGRHEGGGHGEGRLSPLLASHSLIWRQRKAQAVSQPASPTCREGGGGRHPKRSVSHCGAPPSLRAAGTARHQSRRKKVKE